MPRPALARPTVRLPAASAKVPAQLVFPDGRVIALDDPEYDVYLTTLMPLGLPLASGALALVIPEKRGRGGRYWVARAYRDGVREAVYVGSRPDAESLRRAQVELNGRFHARRVGGAFGFTGPAASKA